MSDLGYETSEVEGFLADKGDLDSAKNNTWAAGVKKDYYNHYFYKDVVPLAVAPPDDRSEGAISYNFRRNAGAVDLLADIAAWKVDVLGLSSNFFKTLPTPLGAVENLYKDDGTFAFFFLSRLRGGTRDTAWKKLSGAWCKRRAGGKLADTETAQPIGASSPFLSMVHGVLR
jgi:hypothetical protein